MGQQTYMFQIIFEENIAMFRHHLLKKLVGKCSNSAEVICNNSKRSLSGDRLQSTLVLADCIKERKESEVAQSCPTLCAPIDCVACPIPPSMEFSRQEYSGGWSFSRGSPNPGIKPGCPTLQADALPSEPPQKPVKDREGVFWLFVLLFLPYSLCF